LPGNFVGIYLSLNKKFSHHSQKFNFTIEFSKGFKRFT
jgi:hypothetical protein